MLVRRQEAAESVHCSRAQIASRGGVQLPPQTWQTLLPNMAAAPRLSRLPQPGRDATALHAARPGDRGQHGPQHRAPGTAPLVQVVTRVPGCAARGGLVRGDRD